MAVRSQSDTYDLECPFYVIVSALKILIDNICLCPASVTLRGLIQCRNLPPSRSVGNGRDQLVVDGCGFLILAQPSLAERNGAKECGLIRIRSLRDPKVLQCPLVIVQLSHQALRVRITHDLRIRAELNCLVQLSDCPVCLSCLGLYKTRDAIRLCINWQDLLCLCYLLLGLLKFLLSQVYKSMGKIYSCDSFVS